MICEVYRDPRHESKLRLACFWTYMLTNATGRSSIQGIEPDGLLNPKT